MALEIGQISLDEILITEELSRRVARRPDLEAENAAFRTLVRQLVEQPATLLKTLVQLAKDLCQAGTAGVSLLETLPNGEEHFRWVALAGALEGHERKTTQRHFSPCSLCLERQAPQLYAYPARYFTDLQQVGSPIVEELVIPLVADNQPLGAIWILSHDPRRQFDAEDVRVMASLADLTAVTLYKKRVEEALQQREAELRLITNTVPVLISFVDAEQRYRFNNRTYEEWFGQPAAKVYGKPLWEVLGEAAYGTIRPYVEAVLAGESVTFESEIPYRAGGTRYVSATYIPRWGVGGAVEGFVALVSDISERRRTEKTLQETEQRLRAANERFELAASAVNCLIYEWDVERDIVQRTAGLTQMLGYSLEEAESSSSWWASLIHPDDLQRAYAEAEVTLAYRNRHVVEYRVRHRDGHYIHVLDHGIVVQRDAKGNPSRWVGCTVNIEDRKQVEIALQKSESLLNAFLVSSPIAMAFLDQDLRYLYGNEALAAVNGLPLSEHLGRTLWEVLPDWAPQLAPVIEQVMQTQQPILNQELSGETNPPGTLHHSLVSYYPVCLPDGQVLGVGISSLEISEIKEAEAALRQSEERLRIAQQAAKAGVWDWDIVSNRVIWSEEYYRLYGLDPALPPSYENWLASIAAPDQERVDQTARAALEHQTDLNVEFRILHPTQGERWLTAIGQTLYDANRRPIRMTGIALDITQRKQAEEALRHSEARFQVLVRNMPGMVYRYAPAADGSHVFTYVSSGSRELVELEPETILQDAGSFFALIHSEDWPAFQESVALAVQGGAVWQWEGRFILPSGRLKWIQGRSRPEQTDQGLVWDGLLLDITDRKQAEAERDRLLQREQAARTEAETANRVKDEFLAVLSHELRSPLNPILGWARLLQTREFDQAGLKRAVDTIERNARLQAQLIEDLLDISRILRGKVNLSMAPVNLGTAIEAAMETIRLSAEAKSIQIETQLDASVGLVLGDAGRLQQVFWNLLSNAVKFTPDGGWVQVRLAAIQGDGMAPAAEARPLPTYAQITISDSGKGISRDFLPHVFDSFRQADSSTTRKFGGLGLGLAIVRHLVELHGGTVGADSLGEGQGAVFTVRLPLIRQKSIQPQTATDPAADAERLSPLTGIQILVVDDDADTREFYQFILEQTGATVMVAASAEQALQVLSQSRPDILLSDIGMPEMDGYRLMRQLQSELQGGTKPIPAIALTAYASETDRQQALAAGFQHHIAKPIEPAQLLEAITCLISPDRPT